MALSRSADRVATVVAVVLGLGGALAGIVPALMSVMISDGCSVGCNEPLLTVGWLITLLGAPAVAVLGAVLSIVALARSRPAATRAWGFVLGQAGLYVAGIALMVTAVGW